MTYEFDWSGLEEKVGEKGFKIFVKKQYNLQFKSSLS